MSTARVVITGMGVVSSLGSSPSDLYRGLVQGRSGLREMVWPTQHVMEVRAGGPVCDFEFVTSAMTPVAPHDRYVQMALTAARQALGSAGLSEANYASDRIATVLGVGMGGYDTIVRAATQYEMGGAGNLDPELCLSMTPCIASELVAREASATGRNHCISSACASSAHAIGEAFELLRSGAVDAVITGGAESVLDPVAIAGFERIGALSKAPIAPQKASRPFDRNRDGFVMGEGAAVLVLETFETARRRGAPCYAEILGYGASSDAFHVTRPPNDGNGMARAMLAALRCARVLPEQIQYINAHGTGTPLNDVAETAAIKRVFGEHAPWISSNKSMLGHLLGAAAAVETVATVCTLQAGVVPPTLNLDEPDERCDLDYVPLVAREGQPRLAINNSFGFGGQNACLVLGKLEFQNSL